MVAPISSSPFRRLKLSIVAVLVVALGIGAAIAVPMTASASPVLLSGTVTNDAGTVLAGVTVTPVRFVNDQVTAQGTAVKTSATGVFTFPSLATGKYTLLFAATTTTFEQYLGNTGSLIEAQQLVLQAGGNDKNYVGVRLSMSGALTGKVAVGSTGLANITVLAWSQDAKGGWFVNRSAKTASTGVYTISGLEPGAYRLEAHDFATGTAAYAAQFSGGSTTVDGATGVQVQAKKSTTYNFALGKAGKVSGVVIGDHQSKHEKLKNVVVTPFLLAGAPGAWTKATQLATTATTTATGAYTLSGLAPGTYALQFTPPSTGVLSPSGTTYEQTFLGNTTDVLVSQTVTITNGGVLTGKNISLVGAGSIQGIVTASGSGNKIADVRVVLEYAGANPDDGLHTPRSMVTDGSGEYSFFNVAPGAYEVHFGSVRDSNPRDGLDEDVSWIRQKSAPVVIPTGGDAMISGVLTGKPGNWTYPLVEPSILPVPSAEVGIELTADHGTWYGTPAASTYRYQWYRGADPIVGAVSQKYRLVPGDYGATIRVRVTATDYGYGEMTALTDDVGPISAGDAPTQVSPGAVTGIRQVGNKLSVTPGTWSVGGMSFTYAWSIFDGASWQQSGTGKDYVLTNYDRDIGNQVRVQFTGIRQGYASVTGLMDGGAFSDGVLVALTAPKFARVGTVFKVTAPAVWGPKTADMYTYRYWTVYGADGLPEVSSDPTVPLAAGKYITLTEEAAAAHMASGTVTVVVQKGNALTASGSKSITGTLAVGATLTAPVMTWSQAPGSIAYSWKYLSGSTWATIAGATSATYTPPASLLGKRLEVVEVATTTGYPTTTVTSLPTVAVAIGAAPTIVVAPSTLGSLMPGDGAMATPGTWSVTPTSFTYRWFTSATSGGAPTVLPGATAAQIAVPGSARLKYLSVEVTAHLAGRANGVAVVEAGLVAVGGFVVVTAPKTTKAGSIYTVSNGTWDPAPETFDYEWYSFAPDGSSVTGSTTSSFDAAGLSARRVYVQVKAHGSVSDNTVQLLVQKGTFVPDAALTPSPSPTVKVAAPVTAPAPDWGSPTAAVGYQWQWLSGSTWTNIPSATSASYTPVAAYLGKKLRVKLSVTDFDYLPLTTYSAPVTVASADAIVPGSGPDAPLITTLPTVDGTMTVLPRTWSVASPTFSYAWQESATGVGAYKTVKTGAAATFTVPANRFGYYYRLVITATKAGYLPGTATIDAGAAGIGNLVNKVLPVVTKSGSTLTVSAGTWSALPTGLVYLWERVDPVTDLGTTLGTGKSYLLTGADTAQQIRVTVTAMNPHYNPLQVDVVGQSGGKLIAVTPSTLSGGSRVGQALAVTPGTFNATAGLSYAWYRAGVKIAGQTAASYTQQPADLGKIVSVVVTASRKGFANLAVTLAAPVTLSADVPTAVVLPVISGTAAVDTTITATAGTWSVAGLAYAYAWLRDGAPIAGATAASYAVTAQDEGAELNVRVTASKKNYSTMSATSGAVTAIAGAYLVSTAAPVLTGSHALGSPITSSKLVWNVPVSTTYQWQYRAPGASFWSVIAGAGSTGYTPSAADGLGSGFTVRLVVFAVVPGHDLSSATSGEYLIN